MKFILLISLISFIYAKKPIIVPPKNPNDNPTLDPNTVRNVLVVGSGLAGLSAALELADRGYNVTIKEKSDVIGGKLATRSVQVLGQTFFVEHGFHAWFHNYYQFKDIRDRLNINSNFRVWPAVHFIFRNYKPEVIYSKGPYPFNLIGLIERSPNLKLTDAVLYSLDLPDLMFYDFDKIFEKYDNITFEEWIKEKKVAQDIYDIIMKPGLAVTLNDRDIFSAAEMLMFMQLYFLSNSESDHREMAITDHYNAVLKPWADYLEKKGVNILLNHGVQSLRIDPKTLRVTGSLDSNGNIDDTVYDDVIVATEISATQLIFNNTYNYYNNEPNIQKPLSFCIENYFNKMKTAPDYKVLRVWFDKQLNSSAPDILETPDFTPINLVAQYHLLEEESSVWAEKTGGSILEFHMYTFSKYLPKNTSDEQLWNAISPTVKEIYPEIFDKDFKILAYHVNSLENFASFEKGSYLYRPDVRTVAEKCQLNNSYVAGDWIKLDHPSALMERAVTSGRIAANEILINDNVRQASMIITNRKGPGFFG